MGSTIHHKAFRFRLRSNRAAEAALRRWSGCCRKVRCVACGHTDHADVNAAKNILAAGLAVLAGNGHALVEETVQSNRPVKREPTEGLRHAA